MKILTFGEIIWDVYPDKKCIGGAPLNFAAHARHEGAEAYLLSAVGRDALGIEALEIISKHGVKTDLIQILENAPTGQCTVSLSDRGVPSYKIEENTAYDHISADKIDLESEFDALVFGTLALRCEENRASIKKLIKNGAAKSVFVDLNLRAPFYSRESILMGLENADILKVSDEELPEVMRAVFGEVSDNDKAVALMGERFKNLKLVILTCGSAGSAAYDLETGEIYRCGVVKTEVVSTVGAGDSFGAAFLVSYLMGKSIKSCLERASEVSSVVVSRADALPDIE